MNTTKCNNCNHSWWDYGQTQCPKCGSSNIAPELPIGVHKPGVETKEMDDTIRAWWNKVKPYVKEQL